MTERLPSDLLFVDEDSQESWTIAGFNPELAKELHPTKNGDLRAEKISITSDREVYWICVHGHVWKDFVRNRTAGKGCPFCALKVVENNLLQVYPKLGLIWHLTRNEWFKPENFIPSSSHYSWWKCQKCEHEWTEPINQMVGKIEKHIILCPRCNSLEIIFPKLAKMFHPAKNGANTKSTVLSSSKKRFWWKCPKCGYEYLSSITQMGNSKCKGCLGLVIVSGRNFAVESPEIAKEWDYEKNKELKPQDFSPMSKKSVHWRCSKCGHKYVASISARVISLREKNRCPNGCPSCRGRKVTASNNLTITHPEIAREWDYEKNKELEPSDFTYGSDKMAYWLCKKGHSFKMTISNRTKGRNCQYCYVNSLGKNDLMRKRLNIESLNQVDCVQPVTGERRMPTNIIGRQISQLRSKAGMSQEQLSVRCQTVGLELGRGTLAKVESQVRCVKDSEVLQFAKALNVSISDLFPKYKK